MVSGDLLELRPETCAFYLSGLSPFFFSFFFRTPSCLGSRVLVGIDILGGWEGGSPGERKRRGKGSLTTTTAAATKSYIYMRENLRARYIINKFTSYTTLSTSM